MLSNKGKRSKTAQKFIYFLPCFDATEILTIMIKYSRGRNAGLEALLTYFSTFA